MPQKIIKIGDSPGITINQHILDILQWKVGDIIFLEQGEDPGTIKIVNPRISAETFKKDLPKGENE